MTYEKWDKASLLRSFFSEIKNEVYGLCKKPANKGVVTF